MSIVYKYGNLRPNAKQCRMCTILIFPKTLIPHVQRNTHKKDSVFTWAQNLNINGLCPVCDKEKRDKLDKNLPTARSYA